MSSRKNWTGVFERNWDKLRKKKVAFAPNFFLHKSQKLFKSSCQGKQVLCQPSADNSASRNRLLARGTSFPLDPLSAKGILRKFAIAHKLVCQWRTCTLGLQLSLRSNADPSVIFLPRKVGSKIRENEPFSLTVRQAPQALPIPFFLDCAVTTNTV